MNLPGNILSIPQRAYNYFRELFTSFLESRVTQSAPAPAPAPEPEPVSSFRRVQRGGTKKRRSRRRTRKYK